MITLNDRMELILFEQFREERATMRKRALEYRKATGKLEKSCLLYSAKCHRNTSHEILGLLGEPTK